MRKFVVEWVQRVRFDVAAENAEQAICMVNELMDDNAAIVMDNDNWRIKYLEGYDAVESITEG